MKLILGRKISFLTVGFLMLLFTVGCMSRGWYEERAVNRARTYIFEKCRYLSQLEIEFVKYHKPIVMTEDIVGFSSNHLGRTMPLSQICFAWLIPNRKQALVVFGWGSGDFNDWKANRVFWKRYEKPNDVLISIRNDVAMYAINNMLFMKRSQVNRVRFTVPKQIFTNFDLNKGKTPFEDEAVVRDKLLTAGPGGNVKKDDKKKESSFQVSFYWIDPVDPNSRIVVAGVCDNALLAGYKAVSANFVNADDLLAHTVEKPLPVAKGNMKKNAIKAEKKALKIKSSKKKR